MTSPEQLATTHHLAQKIVVMRLEQIEPNPANVREELGDLGDLSRSIKRHGILQPLTVQPHPTAADRYRLLAGHRRYEAAQLAGLSSVPVIIRHGVDDGTALELMLVENCQRRELGPMERAEALGALVNRGYTRQQIATQVGKSTAWVGHYLALLDLDTASQEKVRAGDLAASHAIRAVRQTRAKTRKKRGSIADFSWEPDHFTDRHQQAKAARKLCEARGHTMRRAIGGVACGACWETAIRLDERKVLEAEDAE